MIAPSAASEEDDVLAAELAFGLLDAEESAAARVRIAADPAHAARFATWERLAAALLDHAEQPAPPALWAKIDAALPANDTARVPTDSAVLAARWRGASVALALTAAVVGALALRTPAPPAPAPAARTLAEPPLVAVLRAQRGAATLAVGFDPTAGRLTLTADALAAGKGSAELWVIPADGTPRSLGVIDPTTPEWRGAPGAARLIAPGVTLAVSLEPPGGSPTGRPSGAPVLTGIVARAVAGGSARGA